MVRKAHVADAPAGDGTPDRSIVCIGPIYLDVNCLSFPCEDGLPAEEERIGRDYEIAAGGSAVNFARFARGLGLDTILAGKVGGDFFGQAAVRMLQEAGVQLAVQTDDAALTDLGINFVAPNGSAVMASVGSASELLAPSDLSGAVGNCAATASGIYLGGCFKVPQLLPYLKELAGVARRKGLTVFLDHGRMPGGTSSDVVEEMRSLARAADVYLPSRDEFLALWDASTLESGARAAFSGGVTSDWTVAVKDGAGGAVAFTADTRVRVPAYQVTVRNTVGAGDSFNAGFVAARSLDFDLRDCLDFACATAAIKISSSDAPTRQSIDRLRAR